MNRLRQLEQLGQSVWLDYIRRDLLIGGGLKKMIAEDGLKGLTSNPAIFEKAIAEGVEYQAALSAEVRAGEQDPERIYERLALDDIRMAADLMAPVHEASGGRDGYVSLEVSPRLAHDTQATVAEARRLWRRAERPNVMIKVPATPAGLPAVEALISDGINVNVTLLFAVETYREVALAYQRGLERRASAGQALAAVASVASFFVSRIDTRIDDMLTRKMGAAAQAQQSALAKLRGCAAISNAKLAYTCYRELFDGARWGALVAKGARPQRLLWASTSTKNPDYPDTIYVDELIGPDTVNTMPLATLEAFRERGRLDATLTRDVEVARARMEELARAGIAMREVTASLLDEGVRLFDEAYTRLLDAIRRARRAA
ncbi:MAG: transaldolase [Betaproteobacteria bacterium]|nr:transaldolase [Betaproteobacteria bacterium]